jgi:hypothetical protein
LDADLSINSHNAHEDQETSEKDLESSLEEGGSAEARTRASTRLAEQKAERCRDAREG